MASKYDLERDKHDTLFYGNINTIDAIVCKLTRGIKCGQQKFHWVVIGAIMGNGQDYCDKWNEVGAVVADIANNRKLNIEPKKTYDSDDFWYLPNNTYLTSSAELAKEKLSKKTPVSRRKLFDELKKLKPPYYELEGYTLKPPVKKVRSQGNTESNQEEKWSNDWDRKWYGQDKDWVFEQAKQ